MKHSVNNNKFRRGLKLIQESETRFVTTHDVVSRFMDSFEDFTEIAETTDSGTVVSRLYGFLVTTDGNQVTTDTKVELYLPTLAAIRYSYAPLRHMQTAIQSRDKPTIYLVLPIMDDLCTVLRQYASVMMFDGHVPSLQLQQFSKVTFDELVRQNKVHYLWLASGGIRPGLRSLSFIAHTDDR